MCGAHCLPPAWSTGASQISRRPPPRTCLDSDGRAATIARARTPRATGRAMHPFARRMLAGGAICLLLGAAVAAGVLLRERPTATPVAAATAAAGSAVLDAARSTPTPDP